MMSHSEGTQVPAGKTFLWAGGGAGTGPNATSVDGAEVLAGGDLTWGPSNAMSPQRGGYAGLAGGGFLFAFGGAQSKPSDSVASAEVAAPPALVNWNNEGVKLLVPRYLSGGCVESAFIYIVGGDTDAGVAKSMERTVL
jgi:hypothetical protein